MEHLGLRWPFWSTHQPPEIADFLRQTSDHIREGDYEKVDLDTLKKNRLTLEGVVDQMGADTEAEPASDAASTTQVQTTGAGDLTQTAKHEAKGGHKPGVQPVEEALPPARHSPDFRSVRWHGVDHNFTPAQAAIVKQLWGPWEQETPDVGAETLLERVDLKTSRLVDIFRGHPAWGTMIVDGATKGSKRLAGSPTP